MGRKLEYTQKTPDNEFHHVWMSVSVLQTVRYTGYSDSVFSSGNPKYHDKVNAWVLYEIEDEIEANKTYTLHNYALIPAVAPSLLEGCGIISTMYQVTVSVVLLLFE